MRKEMNNCLECGADKGTRRKYCSRKCSTRACQKRHQAEHNRKARQRLLDNPIEERRKRAEAAKKWRADHKETSRALSRKIQGTGELASKDEVIFYGYKEPLREYEEGFGYRGVLMYNKTEDKVQCHLCGRLFRSLNNGHLMKVHSVTAREYKDKVGLSQSTALAGEGTREKWLERGHNPNHMETLKRAIELRRERKKKGLPDLQSGSRLSLERHNERGTCPDQLLDIIDKTVKSFGKVPTEDEFLRFHHGKYLGSIRGTYGTWTNALAKLQLKPNIERYTDEHLISAIRTFYEVNKRTPKWSDFRRGLLPSVTAYYNRFRNLNHARLLAGVPLVINMTHGTQEWIPSEDERQIMLAKEIPSSAVRNQRHASK